MSRESIEMEKYTPYSELKIFHHTDRMSGFLRGERVSPIYVRIKPTNSCNQRCYYCAYADDSLFNGRKVDHRESIPWEIMKSVLYEMGEMGTKAVTFSGGGEPLCYHSIIDALHVAGRLSMDYSMITNGQALSGEAVEYLKKAKWIRISFDSSKAETYERTRRVRTYDQILANIERFAHIKNANCTLGMNCVVTKSNADEIFDICCLAKKLGVDNIKLSPILVKIEEKNYHDEIKDTVMQQIFDARQKLEDETFCIVDKYSNDIALDDSYEKEYSECYIQNFFAVIGADAKVYRCHQRAYTKIGEIGDLKQMPFKQIWYAQETIDKVKHFNPKNQCKFRCAFDERNRLLNDFINIDQNHINFI